MFKKCFVDDWVVLFQAVLVIGSLWNSREKKITSFLLEKQFKDKATPVPFISFLNFTLICGNFF